MIVRLLLVGGMLLACTGLFACGSDTNEGIKEKGTAVTGPLRSSVQLSLIVAGENRQATPEEQATMSKALDAFWSVCVPTAGARWANVAAVEANFFVIGYYKDEKGKLVATSYQGDRYGWHDVVEVRVKMEQDAGGREFNGQTFHYSMGGGRQPGIVTGKAGGKRLCGLPGADHGDDTLRTVPALAFMK